MLNYTTPVHECVYGVRVGGCFRSPAALRVGDYSQESTSRETTTQEHFRMFVIRLLGHTDFHLNLFVYSPSTVL